MYEAVIKIAGRFAHRPEIRSTLYSILEEIRDDETTQEDKYFYLVILNGYILALYDVDIISRSEFLTFCSFIENEKSQFPA